MGPLQPNILRLFFACGAVLTVGACVPSASKVERPRIADPRPRRELPSDDIHQNLYSPLAPNLVARVEAGSLGPRLILGEGGKLVVWVTTQGGQSGYFSSFLPNAGGLKETKRLFSAEPALRQLEVGAISPGTVVVSTVRHSGDEEIIEVLYLGAEGELQGGRRRVADVPGTVLWSKITKGADGGLLFWAERSRGLASMQVAPLGQNGPERPILIAKDLASWQLGELDSAIVLATAEGNGQKSVFLRYLGAAGQVVGAPVELARGVDGALDLDLAMTKDRTFVAWSARHSFESRLYGVTLDRTGRVIKAAHPLTVPRGDQALLRLVGSSHADELHVIWDEPARLAGDERSLLVGRVPVGDGPVEVDAFLKLESRDPLLPSFAAGPSGLALLTQAVSCTSPILAGQLCQETRLGRFGVSFGERILSTPLEAPAGQTTMTWDLSCSAQGCYALVADDGLPTKVYLAELAGGELAMAPLTLPSEAIAPWVLANEALFEVPELAALDGFQTSATSHDLLSMISYFDPALPYVTPTEVAPDGRKAPVRAIVRNLVVGPESSDGQPETASEVISYRARSLGGVALVPPEKGEGLVAWAALDGKFPNLFATVIDEKGRRIRQKMLTNDDDEVADVAAIRVGNTYLLAWVNGTDDSAQVYTMLVDAQLRIVSSAQALTSRSVSPTGISLAVVDDRVVLVWADSIGDGEQSDIYLTTLDSKTARSTRAPLRLMESPEHSYSPELAVKKSADGTVSVVCAWVDATIPTEEEETAKRSILHFVELTTDGNSTSEPKETVVDGSVSDFSLSCGGDLCRALLTVETTSQTSPTGGSLWGATYQGSNPPTARKLLTLRAGITTGVNPVLVGSDAYFADLDSSGSRWLLHRAKIQWLGSGKDHQ